MVQQNTIQPPHQKWRPLGMSLLTHSLLVIFLLIFGFFARTPQTESGKLRRAGVVLAVQSDTDTTEYLDESDFPEESQTETQTNQSDPSALPPPAMAAPQQTPDIPELAGPPAVPEALVDANAMSESIQRGTTDSHYELSKDDLKLIAADQKLLKSRAPVGDPTTISVFGSGGVSGRSFVFLIDRSFSMGTQGLGVIEAARQELTEAINQLEPYHKFQIVGYHQRTHTMLRRQLLAASDANKAKVPEHIRSMAAFGSTNHENGLYAALAFKPDAIIFMTDGGYPELNSGQLKMVNKLAPPGCEIHCIQFGIGPLQSTTNFMTKLAQQNDGSFRYIDVSKWKQEN